MDECKAAAERGLTDPVKILSEAYSKMGNVKGSSTACVAVLNGTKFDAVNVGDR